MGMSLPSCPGQKEMQQQIELLQTQNADLGKKIQALTTQIGSVTNDMNQVKQILPQVTGVIEAQKGAIDRIDTRVTDLEARIPKKKKK
jgi:septal ring factor EnvC (AmiA/AmiB activator)